jgi:hypothetical protein
MRLRKFGQMGRVVQLLLTPVSPSMHDVIFPLT